VDLRSKTERLDARSQSDIFRAADLLRTGHTVAFPTETVYGLGADALSPHSVARIYTAKKRPGWDPLIVHICDRDMLARVAGVFPPLSSFPPLLSFRGAAEESASPSTEARMATQLMDAFWPGPLTLLLPRTRAVPDSVTAGRPLVGVRIPAHPIALELIRQAGVPVAAPSANLFGHTSPTTAAHVLADLDGRIDAVLDGGPTQVGLESTVAGVTRDGVTLYRPGAITLEMIEKVVGAGLVQRFVPPPEPETPESQPSPGVTLRHYAPRARLLLVEIPQFRFNGLDDRLLVAIGEARASSHQVGVMLPDLWSSALADFVYPWGPWNDPEVLAQRLFSGLRALDDAGVQTIVCPLPTGDGLAAAIRDRLQKAAR
jgi:L-threonylcarbamoyladenylate synthase